MQHPGDDGQAELHLLACNTDTGAIFDALYTHTVAPNNPGRDCTVAPFDQAHLAASSAHPGGVNDAWADGAVRFIKSGISLPVWKSLGTRCGNEVIDSASY